MDSPDQMGPPTVFRQPPGRAPTWYHLAAEGYRIRCLAPYRRFRGAQIPWDDAELLRLSVATVIKETRSRKVVQLAAGQFGAPLELHVKRYNFRTWLGPLLRLARRSRAREEFDLGWRLLAQGLRTPRPVWLAETAGTVPRFSILATETIPEAHSAIARWQLLAGDQERQELLHALGQFLAQLHEAGFYHDDCKAGHFLLLPGAPAHADNFHVIDLLGGILGQRPSRYRRAKNLYQMLRSFLPSEGNLGFRNAHRRAFLEGYAASPAGADSWEADIARVGKWKGRKI